jgi:hypothetical protein
MLCGWPRAKGRSTQHWMALEADHATHFAGRAQKSRPKQETATIPCREGELTGEVCTASAQHPRQVSRIVRAGLVWPEKDKPVAQTLQAQGEAITFLESNSEIRVVSSHYVRLRWPPAIIVVSSRRRLPNQHERPAGACFLGIRRSAGEHSPATHMRATGSFLVPQIGYLPRVLRSQLVANAFSC